MATSNHGLTTPYRPLRNHRATQEKECQFAPDHTRTLPHLYCLLFLGCLQVIPGSQKGPLYDHFKNGCFASAITDEVFNPKGPTFLEAPAGSITIHHARIVHASAANSSEKPRRVACFTYTAMDAWPLLGVAGPNFLNIGPVSWDLFNATLVRGAPTEYPRLKPCPVKLPLPLQDPTTVIDTFSGKEIPQQSY